jgi:hypothetical protein
MEAQDNNEAQNTSGPRASRARTIGMTTPAATAPTPATASIRPKAAGPSSSRPRTTSGSRAQTAEAETKKAQARRTAARMAGAAATKPSPARMAPSRRSRGSPPRAAAGRRQASRAASSARKARALSAKAAAGPDAARTKPASAGPSARARLKPTPFSAMAPTRSPRGTSSGVAAAQAGKFTAVPALMAKVRASRPQGPSASAAARTASSTPVAAIQSWAAISARRRSRMSATAPPGRAKRKTGSMAAACTRLTISGEGASEVISHPAPVFWIHMPLLEARLAIQSARKAGWQRGAKALGDAMMVRAVSHGWVAPVPRR